MACTASSTTGTLLSWGNCRSSPALVSPPVKCTYLHLSPAWAPESLSWAPLVWWADPLGYPPRSCCQCPTSSLQRQHPLGFSAVAAVEVFPQSAISQVSFLSFPTLSILAATSPVLDNFKHLQLGLLPPRFPSPKLSYIWGPRPHFPQDLPPCQSLLPKPPVSGPPSVSSTPLSQQGLLVAAYAFQLVRFCRLP